MENETPTKRSSIPFILLATVLVIGALFFYVKSNPDLIRSISLEEVAKHADANSCWLVVEGKVYDVTKFVSNHPGKDAILFGCGKDATNMFNSRPKDGTSHSDRARVQLRKYKIGKLSSS